jgi:RNA-dependent RNA polymerase
MTDGCGFLNYAALKKIQENMAWENVPTCIQARVAGAKGLFMLHYEHRDPNEEPQIWMRYAHIYQYVRQCNLSQIGTLQD